MQNMIPNESSSAPEIALIGGGTGSFTLLQELKNLTPNISAIVNMSDDGGSTGVLRDELGVLPPGDVRQCLVALSNMPDIRDIYSYRFGGEGSLKGHSLGNIILSGMEQLYQDFDKALKMASAMLQITGRVIPVTLENHTLIMQDGDEVIEGEHKIGHRSIAHDDPAISLKPPAKLNPEADQAIRNADLLVIAPGNFYGSLLPALVADGMRQAFEATEAKKVMVSNLVTKPGQTDGWHVVDYVKALERYVGDGQIDFVLYNTNLPKPTLLEKYAADGEFPVDIEDSRFHEIGATAVGSDLLANGITAQHKNDTAIARTYIRHNAVEVSKQLQRILAV